MEKPAPSCQGRLLQRVLQSSVSSGLRKTVHSTGIGIFNRLPVRLTDGNDG